MQCACQCIYVWYVFGTQMTPNHPTGIKILLVQENSAMNVQHKLVIMLDNLDQMLVQVAMALSGTDKKSDKNSEWWINHTPYIQLHRHQQEVNIRQLILHQKDVKELYADVNIVVQQLRSEEKQMLR